MICIFRILQTEFQTSEIRSYKRIERMYEEGILKRIFELWPRSEKGY